MKTNIWILNHYASDMYFDRGGRHYNFAKYLRRAGYAPVIFGANSKHGKPERFLETDALWEERIAEEIDTPFVFVRARTYTGNGKQRVLNMIDFYRNVKKAAKEYAAQHGGPDVIFASSVHPLTLVAGIQLAKQFGVKCVCEVRDLWPESIVAYSSRFTKNDPLIRLLYRGEKWIYRKADALVFTMEAAYDYIVERGWEKDIPRSKVHYINNGVDLEQFDYNKEHFRVDDPDLLDTELFKMVFTGTLVTSNNIDGMLNLAKRLQKYPNMRLLIWGNGECTEAMQQRIRDEGIENVRYKGVVEKNIPRSLFLMRILTLCMRRRPACTVMAPAPINCLIIWRLAVRSCRTLPSMGILFPNMPVGFLAIGILTVWNRHLTNYITPVRNSVPLCGRAL